jgi:endonuclease/exonuclease/phosphatase family metal-dependent hydrolase/lysophospholipase L1-like esterase
MPALPKHLINALLLLACLAVSACGGGGSDKPDPDSEPKTSEQVSLRVMSYNISHGRGLDMVTDLDRQAAVISSQMPDLVALQEVDNGTTRSLNIDQAATIASAAGMPYYLFGRAIDLQGGEYGIAILSRYPIRFSGVELLPVTGGLEQRIALWVEVEVPGIGPVLFVNTHIEAYSIEQDRLDQIAKLNELFADSPITPAGTAMPEIVILAGDFNADTGSDAINLLETRFTDGYIGPLDLTFPSDIPTNAYDKIFHATASSLKTVQSWVLDDPVSSDHRPVIVDFEMLAAGGFTPFNRFRRVLAIGDSLVIFPESAPYWWQAPDETFNEGVSGDYLSDILADLPGNLAANPTADSVYLLGGGNSLRFDVGLPTVQDQLADILTMIEAKGLQAIVSSMTPLRDGPEWDDTNYATYLAYNNWLPGEVTGRGHIFADVYELLEDPDNPDNMRVEYMRYGIDPVHLSDEGGQMIAEYLDSLIYAARGVAPPESE